MHLETIYRLTNHVHAYFMCLHSIPQVECLEWILDHGGSIHDRDNLGGTPVHDAAEQGQVHIAVCSSCVHVTDLSACCEQCEQLF